MQTLRALAIGLFLQAAALSAHAGAVTWWSLFYFACAVLVLWAALWWELRRDRERARMTAQAMGPKQK